MENASKALIMASGILLAIVLIAAFINSLSTVNSLQMSQYSEEEQEELIAFNEQYTKYVGQYVYGTEVITIINKTLDSENYPITTKINFNNDYTYGIKKYDANSKSYKIENVTINHGTSFNITNDDGTKSTNSVIEHLTRRW